jgi:Flp pilus assembly protein TadD
VLYHVALLLIHFDQYESAGQILLEFALHGKTTPAIVEAAGLAGLRKPLLPSEIPAEDHELINLAGSAVEAAGAGNVAEARKQLGQLMTLFPAKPNVHYLYASFLLQSDPGIAVGEFQKELDLDPNHVPALVAIGMEYLKEGDSAKGLPYAERAVQAEPQSFAAHAALGKVLAATGPQDRAIQELETAERLAPDSPQVRIALASAYAKAGRKEDAARERAEFLRLKKLGEKPDAK